MVLAVPEGEPADINSYGGLKAGLETGAVFMSMGGGVPVGQYIRRTLEYFGLDEEALARGAPSHAAPM